jgi:hypothetical protein
MEVNIDAGKALLVIVLTIGGVILINLAIYAMVKGKGTIGQIELMRKAANQARNPWELEDKALKDLSELVKQLKNEPVSPDQADNQTEKPGKDT